MSILDDIKNSSDSDFFDYEKYRAEQEILKKATEPEPPKKPDKKTEKERIKAEKEAERERKKAEKLEAARALAEEKKKLAEKAEADRKLAEEKRKAEKAEADKKLAEEKAKAEAEKKLADEKKKAEAEKKLAEEKAKAEAEKKLADEKKKAEAEKKLAEEKKKADAEKKLAEDKKKAEKAEEKKSHKETVEKPVVEMIKPKEEKPEPKTTDAEPITILPEDLQKSFLSKISESAKQEKPKSEKPSKQEKQEKPKKAEKKSFYRPEEKSHSSSDIKHVIEDALDEDLNEIAEFSDEPEALETVTRKSSFKRNIYFAIGVLVSLMALIGFIFTIVYICGIASRITNNTKQKEMFTEIIYPMVITDPAGFEEASQLSNESMLSAAIWDIILYADTSKYTNEFGNITVPQADVELHATKLFGAGLKFQHQDIGDISLTFYYDPELKSYIIPVSPQYFTYSPQIDKITRSGDTYTLLVGYISPSPSWMVLRDEQASLPDKYMEYTLLKSNNQYTIVSIKEVEGLGIGDKAY